MVPVLAFDIETVPDTAGLRRLHDLPAAITDADDFLPLHLHRVVAISCVLRDRDGLRVWSLGESDEGEDGLIRRFFDGIEKFTPQLVSWNGGGFDLPVLHYRALVHRVRAHRYWEMGDEDRDFRYNNYISRYHTRHIDLMDLLGLYQGRVPLDELAQLLGLPGKVGMHGSQVWEAFLAGQIEAIRSYCEADVANTYLVYLRFQHMRGFLSDKAFASECAVAREAIERLPGTHWKIFLDGWTN
jgi:predicted PolB exonuclease-like 3'-5' exonuclease